MAVLKIIFLAALGLSAGGVVAGGLFDFIVMIGVVSRIIGKTHTSHHIRLYENTIIAGGVIGCIVSVYDISLRLGSWVSGVYGIFSGIFIGCLIMSLTETLDGIPILSRRLKLTKGLKYIILGLAVGKAVGALLYFWQGNI